MVSSHRYCSLDVERVVQSKIAQNLMQVGLHVVAGPALERRAQINRDLQAFAGSHLGQNARPEPVPQFGWYGAGDTNWHLGWRRWTGFLPRFRRLDTNFWFRLWMLRL